MRSICKHPPPCKKCKGKCKRKETGVHPASLVSERMSFIFPEKLALEASAFNKRDEGGQWGTILRILTNCICISDYYNELWIFQLILDTTVLASVPYYLHVDLIWIDCWENKMIYLNSTVGAIKTLRKTDVEESPWFGVNRRHWQPGPLKRNS